MKSEYILDFNQVAPHSVFGEIRQAFRFVSENAQYVRIDYSKLMEYTKTIRLREKSGVYDTEHHFIDPANLEKTAAYVTILDSVNFAGPLKHELVKEGMELIDNSLYFAVATRLRKVFLDRPDGITVDELTNMTKEDCRAIFKFPDAPTAWKICTMFAQSMRSLGQMLEERHSGRFLNMIDAANGSADSLVRALSEIDGYNDYADYSGMRIPFLKRAQITVADLHLAFQHMGQRLFKDIHDMTMFPDNAVAHTLHVDGILIYADELKSKILNGVELSAGSSEEIEIRACTARAVDALAAYTGLMPINVDHVLWHRSHDDGPYQAIPCHKTMTPYY